MRCSVALIGLLSLTQPTLSYICHSDIGSELQIRNRLSLYAIAVDTKNFGLLTEVFTQNAIADYSAPPPNNIYYGLPAIQEFLKLSLNSSAVSQHAISTTVADFTDSFSPNSTAYVVASFLGQGNRTGQALYIYGKYMDRWTYKLGSWKITNRLFSLIVCVGFT